MAATSKDIVLVVSLVLSVVLLFGVTWHFQSSLDLLQQQIEYDRELLLKLPEQINVSTVNYTLEFGKCLLLVKKFCLCLGRKI